MHYLHSILDQSAVFSVLYISVHTLIPLDLSFDLGVSTAFKGLSLTPRRESNYKKDQKESDWFLILHKSFFHPLYSDLCGRFFSFQKESIKKLRILEVAKKLPKPLPNSLSLFLLLFLSALLISSLELNSKTFFSIHGQVSTGKRVKDTP